MPRSFTGLDAARLRALREAAGLSEGELATRVGVVRTAVRAWEAGTSAPTAHRLAALATALGVGVDDLVPTNLAADDPHGLAALRGRAGLYQREVAEQLHTTEYRYGRVERGDVECPPEWVPDLARLLDTTPQVIVLALPTEHVDVRASARASKRDT